jgi:ribosomal protein S18 acetylase RimI-like enzyme
MPETRTQLRQASAADAPRMLRLLDQAVRQYVSFGKEDLQYLLAKDRVWLADTADALWGFLCITPRSSGVADLRGLALVNGWRVDAGVQTLLLPVVADMQEKQSGHLVCLGTAAWIVPPLQRTGFDLVDRIVYFERPVAEAPLSEASEVAVRPIRGNDLSTLLSLDSSAFEPLWRFDQGHFMELLVTSGHSTIAERSGEPVGYAITDVLGDTGFVVRVAVHPHAQGEGIGGRLLADALDHCRAAGAAFVRLNTQESNVASQHLYQRFGFRRAGRRVPVLVREL